MTPAQRISRFLHSPHGRRVIEEGRRQLAKPSTQRKLRNLVHRLTHRRR